MIISFRATGEGHISSIVFESGVLDRNGNLTIEPVGKMLAEADVIKRHVYDKKAFRKKLADMQVQANVVTPVLLDKPEVKQDQVNIITPAKNAKPDELQEPAKVIYSGFYSGQTGR